MTPRGKSSGDTVRITVDSADVREQLKQARRLANKNVRDGIKRAVELSALPEAQLRAPSFVRLNVAAGSSAGRGFLTFKGTGRLRKAAALLNFGGTRRDVIRPKKAKALALPFGYRASVKGKRTYKAKGFMQAGAAAGLPEFSTIVMREVMRSFDGLSHN